MVMVTLGVVKCRLQRICMEGNIGIMVKRVRWGIYIDLLYVGQREEDNKRGPLMLNLRKD